MLPFWHVINTNLSMRYFTFFGGGSESLRPGVYFILTHILIWTSCVAGAQGPDVAMGHPTGEHGSGRRMVGAS